MVKDTKNTDDFMQFIHVPHTVQPAADTLVNQEVVLPTNSKERLALAIHTIEWGLLAQAIVNGSWVQMTLATRDDILAGDLHLGNPDVIATIERETLSAGAAFAFNWEVMPNVQDFDPPFLLGQRRIWFYVTSAATTLLNAGSARIGFTFAKVSLEEFWESTMDWRM